MGNVNRRGNSYTKKAVLLGGLFTGFIILGAIPSLRAQQGPINPILPPLRILHAVAVDCSKGTECYGLSGGKVKVHVVIGAEGKATSVVAVDGDRRFFGPVIKAVYQYRFSACLSGQSNCAHDITVVSH
jgi:hypothetical protein